MMNEDSLIQVRVQQLKNEISTTQLDVQGLTEQIQSLENEQNKNIGYQNDLILNLDEY